MDKKNKVYDLVYEFSKGVFFFLILSFILIVSGFYLIVPVSLFIKYYYGEKIIFKVSVKKSFSKMNVLISLLFGFFISLLIVSLIFVLFYSVSMFSLLLKLLFVVTLLFILYSTLTTYCNYQVKNIKMSLVDSFYFVSNNFVYAVVSFLMTFSISFILFMMLDIFFVGYASIMIILEYKFFNVYFKSINCK